MEEQKSEPGKASIIYPTFWKPRIILFLPRDYWLFILMGCGSYYTVFIDRFGAMITLVTTVFMAFVLFFYGFASVKDDPFFFNVFTKYASNFWRRSAHDTDWKGNVYRS